MIRTLFSRVTGFMVLAALLFITGLVMVARLPVMMYPQTERPRVRVSINHPGISAVEFQNTYADYIEPHLAGLDNLEIVESTYAAGQSSFNLTFDWNIDRRDAIDDVEGLLQSINTGFPEEIRDSYRVGSWQSENAGYLVMGVFSASASPEDLHSMLSRNVAPRLNSVSDVEEIGFYNVEDLNVEIILKQASMLPFGVTIADVDTALRQGIVPVPLGSLREEGTSYSIRFSRDSRGLYDLERLSVKQIGDRTVTLGEIADISITYDLPGNLFLVNGDAVVQLTATPVEGGNINQMTADIMEVMEVSRATGLIPSDAEFHLFLDPAKYIQRAIANVVRAALIGGVLAVLVVFLILGEVRNTLIIAFSLPFTIVLSFILMFAFGVTLNLISLGGIALAVGMVIDSTIVVMENIHRLRVLKGTRGSRNEWRELVSAATDQVRGPVIASVLTSVLVFLPISFTAPLTNAILGDQARTVIFSLLTSLFVALLLVPIVAYALYHPGKGELRASGPVPEKPRGFARVSIPMMKGITGVYRRALDYVLRRKILAISLILSAFGILAVTVIYLLPVIPKEIISPPSSDRVVIFFRNFVDYPDTRSVMEQALPDIESRIRARVGDYVVQTYANVRGRANMIFIDLADARNTDFVQGELQDEFLSQGNNYYSVMPWDPAQLPLPNTESLRISVFGPDEARKIALLEEIQDLIRETDLYRSVRSVPSPALSKELILTSREGIVESFPEVTESSLNSLVRLVLAGTSSIDMMEGEFEVGVRAQYPDETVDTRGKLKNFLIPLSGRYVPLKHFFDFREESNVSEIFAVNGEPAFRLYGRIFGNVPDRVRVEYERQIGEMLEAKLVVPDGYSWIFENPQVEMEKSINSLYVALGISIILIYLLLSFQFNSLWLPLVILVSIPLGFIGVIISLKIFGSTLSLNSMLGTILLGGIVVNNAIILIDFWLKSRNDYEDGITALVDTAAIRFQPIIITTVTTILGMLPIAVGLGDGSNILQPLGIAVSGGLFISTAFTLFIVPSLLSLTERTRQ